MKTGEQRKLRKDYLKIIHQNIKKNPEAFQFYSNLISSFITLLALGATIYFSLRALKKTDTQNQNAVQQLNQAKAQLTLAQQQFQYAKKLHTEDSIASSFKDSITNERFIKDTIKQGYREKMQENRDHLQFADNKQQYALNKEQLKAIQIQARTAEEQFNQQKEQYQQQLYEQRPVFFIDSANINTINTVKSTISSISQIKE